MKSFVTGLIATHLLLSALYVLPHEFRSHPYNGTWFEQGWPLFSSHYPLGQVLRVHAVCANGRQVALFPINVSPWASRPLKFRLQTASLHVPHFRYAREVGDQRTPQGFLEWLAEQKDVTYMLHAYDVLARGACTAPRALRIESCPLSNAPCVDINLDLFEHAR